MRVNECVYNENANVDKMKNDAKDILKTKLNLEVSKVELVTKVRKLQLTAAQKNAEIKPDEVIEIVNEAKLEEIKKEVEIANKPKKEAEEKATALVADAAEKEKAVVEATESLQSKLKAVHLDEMQTLKNKHSKEIKNIQNDHQTEKKKAVELATETLQSKLKAVHDDEMQTLKNKHSKEIKNMQNDYQREKKEIIATAKGEKKKALSEAKEILQTEKFASRTKLNEYKEKIRQLKSTLDERNAELDIDSKTKKVRFTMYFILKIKFQCIFIMIF